MKKKAVLSPELKFGSVSSDHMLEIDYIDNKWCSPVIKEFSMI